MVQRRMGSFLALLLFAFSAGVFLLGCGSSSSGGQAEVVSSSSRVPKTEELSSEKRSKKYNSYSDIPTPYPTLYCHDAESGWLNIYDESKVVNYADAYRFAGKDVTVEGSASSIVYAASSNGSPYFINMGEGDFAAVIWSQDLASFDQIALHNYVEWSKSDQPLTLTFRISGTVEMYDGRPQIVARDGSQIATMSQYGTWFTMMSDDSVNALMRQRRS